VALEERHYIIKILKIKALDIIKSLWMFYAK